jgi:hypothetical protein
MTKQFLEDFITKLDQESRDMCVYPDKQTIDCIDCYNCRVDYFNQVRQELINEYGLE